MREEKSSIFMDKASYEHFLDELEKLEDELREVNLTRGLVHKRPTDDEWDNAEFREVERKVAILSDEINLRKKMLSRIVITNKIDDETLVDFGDILELKINDADGIDTYEVKLVGHASYSANAGYIEISTNSVIGSLIYGEKVGTKKYYNDKNGIRCSVEIVDKLYSANKDINTCAVNNVKPKRLVKTKTEKKDTQ